MKKALVLLCWLQVIVATAFVLLNFYSLMTRPTAGLESQKGVVTRVEGAAERAGLQKGDRVISIGGRPYQPGNMFYFERAGKPTTVVYERNGVTNTTELTPVMREETRRAALRRGGGDMLNALADYLNYPLHIWMLGLGIALLVLRPEDKDARLSALSLTYWAGGSFLAEAPGMGAILGGLPYAVQFAIFATNAFFLGAFFAACMHFALIFPSDRAPRVRRALQFVPWVIASPIAIEAFVAAWPRFHGSVAAARLPWDIYPVLGPVCLFGALAILAMRFLRVEDVNARRRLELIFLALLPGSLAFAIGTLILDKLGPGPSHFGRLLNIVGTAMGSGIYAYAVVRHRMFNIRVLVRRSIQYALARGTLLVAMSLPVIGLGLFLYAHRRDSLAVLLTGEPAVYFLLIIPLILVIRYRKRVLDAVDRRFFREQYDARQLLLQVVSMIRDGSDMLALTRASLDEIDRALHPKHISLWVYDDEQGGRNLQRAFYRGEAPAHVEPLAVGGSLPTLLANSDEPLDVHARATRGLLQRLPQHERDWLAGTQSNLLVPLLIEDRLAGLMVLGERKSEEPYSREDRELLRMLAAQLALSLDYSRLKQSPSLVWAAPPSASFQHSLHLSDVLRLCPSCGRCYAPDETTCEIDQQALVPEAGVPRIIEDKYVVTRLLGRGGMGSVYQANQKRLNRPVAVKVLLSHLVGSTSMRTRFEREARIVARLRHPAIVTIHDFGVLPSGHAYLVMEYLDGQTLRKTIASGPQPWPRVLEILSPVADAIDSAHRLGVVHRDLKPENIMLVREHDGLLGPRVLDFGLAKLTGPIGDDENTLVQSQQSIGVVGTLMYIAPEILTGGNADARSDQYALALIAYELLTGEHPLAAATDLASVVRGHTEEPMIPVRQKASDVPVNVAAAIHKALAKKAVDRYETVSEFLTAMR